jgi:glycosyltransferase involved in cell wall biosynthesis
VNVYATLGKFAPSDLRATGRALDRFPGPLRLLVQWVPHGYGYKSLNLPFCIWLSYRKWHHGDQVDLVVHEPFLPFKKGKWRQNAAAIMHRVMMMVLLRTADRVWLSTPAWEKMIRPFSLGRRHTYNWLPLPSNVPVVEDPAAAWAIHAKYSPKGFLIGHFGTFGSPITPILQAIVPPLLRRTEHASLILIGPRSSGFRDRLVQEHPDLAKRIHAVGPIDARDVRLSAHIRSCDLMIQPYPDGVTSRRTSVMAALAHARPTVSTSGPLTEPFWDSSGAVALAPAGDNEAFVESALRILGDPQHRSSLGEAAGKFYRREFDVERIIERLRAIDQGAEPGWAEPKGR